MQVIVFREFDRGLLAGNQERRMPPVETKKAAHWAAFPGKCSAASRYREMIAAGASLLGVDRATRLRRMQYLLEQLAQDIRNATTIVPEAAGNGFKRFVIQYIVGHFAGLHGALQLLRGRTIPPPICADTYEEERRMSL
jgi:hypothetical protein